MRGERLAALVIIAFAAAYFVMAFFIPSPMIRQQLGPEAFPKAVGVFMLLCSIIYLVQQLRKTAAVEDETRAAIIGADEKLGGAVDYKTVGLMLALMLAYAFLFERLGYAIATFLVFMGGVLVLDRRHLPRDVVIALIASFGLYFVFRNVLGVQLPPGPLRFL